MEDPFDNYLDLEFLPYKILEPLAPKYEEMRKVLDYMPEVDRQKQLAFAVFSAINSDNPMETINKKLSEFRNDKTSVMMLNDLASASGQNKEDLKQMLKFKFKKRNFNKK